MTIPVKQNMRILIVDDDETLRQLLRMTLENENMELFEAANGTEALELYRAILPDIVLVDIMMPGELDGYQVCSEIKKGENAGTTKVIIVSARGQQKDIEKGRESGADHYLVKPYHPTELLSLIRAISDSQHSS